MMNRFWMQTYLQMEEEKRSLIVESCCFSLSDFLHKDDRALPYLKNSWKLHKNQESERGRE